jgi:hypothetical protein
MPFPLILLAWGQLPLQQYNLQAYFNPNWTATPQGFNGSGGIGTSIDIFYGADATSSSATTPMTFSAPTPFGAGLGITGASGPVSLTTAPAIH